MTEENLRAKNIQEAKSVFLRLITVVDSLYFQNYDYIKCLVTKSYYSTKTIVLLSKLFLYFMLSDGILFKNFPTRRRKCA